MPASYFYVPRWSVCLCLCYFTVPQFSPAWSRMSHVSERTLRTSGRVRIIFFASTGASNCKAPTCNGCQREGRAQMQARRIKVLRLSSPLLPSSLRLVINVEYPRGGNAPILPFLSLSELTDSSSPPFHSAPLPPCFRCPDFFSLFHRACLTCAEGGGRRSALLTPHGANNLPPRFPIMLSVRRVHLAQGHLFTAKLTLFTCLLGEGGRTSAWQKRTEPPQDSIFFFFVITT